MDEEILAQRFMRGRLLGKGTFGRIYAASDSLTGLEVALKCEPVRSRRPTLPTEARILRELQGERGIPKVYWSGVEQSLSISLGAPLSLQGRRTSRTEGVEADQNVLALEICGSSLEELFSQCGRKMSIKSVAEVLDQMIDRVESVHSHHYLHRDIKPENFLMGASVHSDTVFLIDFGLSKRFRDARTMQHVAYREGLSLTGTARYASLNAHRGLEQGRRDDLESMVYVAVYFLRGGLPWQGVQAQSKLEKYRKIMDLKTTTPIEQLCPASSPELAQMLAYTRSLKFEDQPDYSFYRRQIHQIASRENFSIDRCFDWTVFTRHRSLSSSGLERRSSFCDQWRKREEETVEHRRTIARQAEADMEEEQMGLETRREKRCWPQVSASMRKAIAADKSNRDGDGQSLLSAFCGIF